MSQVSYDTGLCAKCPVPAVLINKLLRGCDCCVVQGQQGIISHTQD